MKKNLFLTFCTSLAPGCGQMYQGYLRRGFSMLAWFCLLFFVAVWMGIGELSIFLMLIWAVSFFDSFNLRALSPEQRAVFQDDFLPSEAWLRGQADKSNIKARPGKILGWACIAVGILMLYNNILAPILYRLADYFTPLYNILSSLPAIIIAIGAIALGLWMLRGNKGSSQTDDIPPYNGEDNHENS